MAVENPPLPTQPASPRLTISRDFIQVIGTATGLAAVIIAGMALVMSITIAPIREDMRSMRSEMQRGFETVRGEIAAVREDMNNEFKAIRKDIAGVSERLTRVETRLERDADRAATPEAPQ